MKNSLILGFLAIISLTSFAQKEELKLDENLIIKVANVNENGEISISDLQNLKGIDINDADVRIVSFIFSYMIDKTTLAERKVNGSQFSEELLEVIKGFKEGQKFYIEKVVVETTEGNVTTNPVRVKVKS